MTLQSPTSTEYKHRSGRDRTHPPWPFLLRLATSLGCCMHSTQSSRPQVQLWLSRDTCGASGQRWTQRPSTQCIGDHAPKTPAGQFLGHAAPGPQLTGCSEPWDTLRAAVLSNPSSPSLSPGKPSLRQATLGQQLLALVILLFWEAHIGARVTPLRSRE